MAKKPITIYYDGTCPMCNAFAGSVRKKAPEQELVDASKPHENAPASPEALMKDMHLIDSDGTVRVGADAVLTSLAYTNKLYWPLSRLIRVWPFSAIAQMVYRLVATHRHTLSGKL